MSTSSPLKDKAYAVRWAAIGVFRPSTTTAFLRARKEAEREWQNARPQKLEDLGTASKLSILPLIDWYSRDPRLATEPGVSYLVTVDGKKILFDVGRNLRQEHPSPLLRNMEALGISPADLDAVFISHNHLDHVGGAKQMSRATFTVSAPVPGTNADSAAGAGSGYGEPGGLAAAAGVSTSSDVGPLADPVDLSGVTAYAPTPMTHSSARMEVVTGPRKLGGGLASTGPITRAIWYSGPVAEQSLLVNLEGKGVVMIVGCGHPSLARLIERAQMVTGAPLYGAVGGLHFPVTGSRMGRGFQNILGNGKLPWQRITRNETRDAAKRLAELDLRLVALSAHDTCDWSLGVFTETLGDRCRTVKVGEEIIVA